LFFAGIPPENLFSLGYADRHLECVMKEKRIPYLILYTQPTDPPMPGSKHCQQELALHQGRGEDQILLFKCDGDS
jgi:hypothetical protein